MKPVSGKPASGYQRLMGYRLVEWRQGLAVFELDVEPHHLNSNGAVHGGVPATLIDVACTYAGTFAEPGEERRRSVTLSLHTSFLATAREGTLRVVGRRAGGGQRIYFARAEVFDAADTLIATGEGTFRYL